jgi:molybdopterin-guanine dinucleotide biosynthesis protein A
MGRPKHLLAGSRGGTWLEDTVALLRPLVERVVLAGQGLVPPSLQDLTRVTDVPGVAGPLAGILAAMRWQPEVSWLLVACDMPSLGPEALQWLIASRRPGRWATMPRRSLDSHVEPLLGHYDRRCRSLFEEIRLAGSLRIGLASRHKQVYTPLIPHEIISAWENVNTPEELACLATGRRAGGETGDR